MSMSRTATSRIGVADDNLVDGIQPWMMGSVVSLLKEYFIVPHGRDRKTNETIMAPYNARIDAVERYLRIQLPSDDENDLERYEQIIYRVRNNEMHALDMLEAVLATCESSHQEHYMHLANTLFQEGSSKWIAVKNDDGNITLEERVDETMRDAFEDAVSVISKSSDYLKESWIDIFGRNPNPSDGYGKAIKAIEAASWPIILPNDNTATLGKIIGEVGANPNKWASSISEKTPSTISKSLEQQMRLVWEGQTNRHGTATPIPESQEAAEQAIIIAVGVCNQFNRGHIKIKL